ncbi:MAG: hypothetical protein ACI9XJ_002698, partial [Marivirga sp.]
FFLLTRKPQLKKPKELIYNARKNRTEITE